MCNAMLKILQISSGNAGLLEDLNTQVKTLGIRTIFENRSDNTKVFETSADHANVPKTQQNYAENAGVVKVFNIPSENFAGNPSNNSCVLKVFDVKYEHIYPKVVEAFKDKHSQNDQENVLEDSKIGHQNQSILKVLNSHVENKLHHASHNVNNLKIFDMPAGNVVDIGSRTGHKIQGNRNQGILKLLNIEAERLRDIAKQNVNRLKIFDMSAENVKDNSIKNTGILNVLSSPAGIVDKLHENAGVLKVFQISAENVLVNSEKSSDMSRMNGTVLKIVNIDAESVLGRPAEKLSTVHKISASAQSIGNSKEHTGGQNISENTGVLRVLDIQVKSNIEKLDNNVPVRKIIDVQVENKSPQKSEAKQYVKGSFGKSSAPAVLKVLTTPSENVLDVRVKTSKAYEVIETECENAGVLKVFEAPASSIIDVPAAKKNSNEVLYSPENVSVLRVISKPIEEVEAVQTRHGPNKNAAVQEDGRDSNESIDTIKAVDVPAENVGLPKIFEAKIQKSRGESHKHEKILQIIKRRLK